MITPTQGVTHFIVPAIIAVAVHKITQSNSATIATFIGGMGVAAGFHHRPKTTAKVLAVTTTSLAAGTLLFLASEKIEASVPFGGVAGFGLAILWPTTTETSGSEGLNPTQVLVHKDLKDLTKSIDTLLNEEITQDSVDRVYYTATEYKSQFDVLVKIEYPNEELSQYLEGCLKLIIDQCTGWDNAHKKQKQINQDNLNDQAMRVELEKEFRFVEVADDGSCLAHAVIASLENTEIDVEQVRSEIQSYICDEKYKDEKLDVDTEKFDVDNAILWSLYSAQMAIQDGENGKVAQLIRAKYKDNNWRAFSCGDENRKLYAEAVIDLTHWFCQGDLPIIARALNINIGVYTGKPVLNNDRVVLNLENDCFRCQKHKQAPWAYLWLEQGKAHYWGLKPKKEV